MQRMRPGSEIAECKMALRVCGGSTRRPGCDALNLVRPSQHDPGRGHRIVVRINHSAADLVLTPVQHQRQMQLVAGSQMEALNQD